MKLRKTRKVYVCKGQISDNLFFLTQKEAKEDCMDIFNHCIAEFELKFKRWIKPKEKK